MTKSFMQEHQNGEVRHFLHREASTVDIVCVCLVHRSVYRDVHQQEAYRKIMLKHWQRAAPTAAAPNIKALTHRPRVSN